MSVKSFFKKPSKVIIKGTKTQKITSSLVVLIFVAVGVYLLIHSFAQSPYASVDASTGSVVCPAFTYSDTSADNGQAVQFGSSAASTCGSSNNEPLLGFFPGNSDNPNLMPGQVTAGDPIQLPNLGHPVALGEFYLANNSWGIGSSSPWGMNTSLSSYWTGSGSTGPPWSNYNYRMVVAVPMLVNNITTGLTLTNSNGSADTNGNDYAAAANLNGPTSFQDCATTATDLPYGPYGQYYVDLAKEMESLGIKNPIVRLNWEFNGLNSFGYSNAYTDFNPDVPYSDNFQNFIKCYQDEAGALKATDPSIKIDFDVVPGNQAGNSVEVPSPCNWPSSTNCTSEINDGCNPSTQSCQLTWVPFDWTTVYPGNQYVDIIGYDEYDASNTDYPAGANNNPSLLPCTGEVTGTSACIATQNAEAKANEVAAWKNALTQTDGLQEQVSFAKAHGKLMSFPEWGLWIGCYDDQCGGDDPYYIQQMYNWMTNANNVNGYESYYYESYFNSDSNGSDNAINDGQFPNSLSLFTQLFTPLAAEAPNWPQNN